MSGFNITPSTSFQRAMVSAATLDLVKLTQAATATVATQFVKPLQESASTSGASKKAVGEIAVHKVDNPNDLVMRQRGETGDVMVGVTGHSPEADSLDELEWGGVAEGPRAWVRNFHTHHAHEVYDAWSSELTNELNRRLK